MGGREGERGRCLLQVHLGGARLGDMEHVQRDALGHGQWHPIHHKTAKKSKQRKENAKKKEDRASDRAIGRYLWCFREEGERVQWRDGGAAGACIRRSSAVSMPNLASSDLSSSDLSSSGLSSSDLSPMPVPNTDARACQHCDRDGLGTLYRGSIASDSPESSSSCSVCGVPVQNNPINTRAARQSLLGHALAESTTSRSAWMTCVTPATTNSMPRATRSAPIAAGGGGVERHAGGVYAGEDDEVGAVRVGLVVGLWGA